MNGFGGSELTATNKHLSSGDINGGVVNEPGQRMFWLESARQPGSGVTEEQ